MICIETERLLIRELKETDFKDIMEIWGNYEVMKYCGVFENYGSDHFINVIRRYNKLQENRGFSVYCVLNKKTGNLLGVCGFNPVELSDELELIYHFKKNQWGRGYATESCNAILDYIKAHFSNTKVIASVNKENTASRRVLEKLGFKYIGDKWYDDSNEYEPFFELVI